MEGPTYFVVFFIIVCCAYSSDVPETVDMSLHNASGNANPTKRPSPQSGLSATIAGASGAISRLIKDMVADELGLSVLQSLLASTRTSSPPSDDDLLLAFSERLSSKLTLASKLLFDMKKLVMNDSFVRSFTHPCPLNVIKKTPIMEKSEKISLDPPKTKSKPIKQYVTPDKLKDDSSDFKVKRRYFMAASDGATDKECRLLSDDLRLRRLFHDVFQPESKYVILVVDHGRYLHVNEFRIAISIAIELINMLHKNDIIALIVNDVEIDKRALLYHECDRNSSVGLATDKNKDILLKYLNNLDISDDSIPIDVSHVHEAVRSIPDNLQENAMVVYIGKDSDWFKELRNSTITNIDSDVQTSPIILNSCDVSNENDFEEYDELFLPHCNKNRSEYIFCQGKHVHFNSSFTVGQVSSLFLLTLNSGNDFNEIITLPPVWDPVQRDLLIPLALPCVLRGVVILDVYLADLAQDVIYFDPLSHKHRSFLTNLKGEVIMHSSYSRPEAIIAKPKIVDISLLEPYPGFSKVRSLILTNSSGKSVIYNSSTEIVYTWKWVKKLYVLCIVSEIDTKTSNSSSYIKRISSRTIRDLQYHRIDLLPPSTGVLCRHFKQVSTIDRATLYLSPSSFQFPFRYLFDVKNGKEMSLKMLLQSCMAYLKDSTRLLSNPGLKPEIRRDVGLLYSMLNYYKKQHIHGSHNKYIVRRYAATNHGVLVMFPGTILESDYEPNRKSWFTKATLNPGKIIFTPPYLDVGGAGYIVTISYATKDTLANSRPLIVASMDVTLGFIHKILIDSLLLCSNVNVKCFLMDEQGYLLSHPSLFGRKGVGPIEQQHITHKESLIASDMLNHKGFVEKKLCKNYMDGTLQRYYKFNNSITNVLTNLVHGEHCARYHITSIHGTNIFLGMVKTSCDMGAFCPCSVIDRLCLNCNRMEQIECECPCECVLSTSTCSAPSPEASLCELQPERNNQKNNFFYNLATHLKPCFDFQCDSYRTKSSCLGVLGCEWCDSDGESSLVSPFCSAQYACFGGVLGADTPYGEGSLGHVVQDDLLATYSAVGPIAGCIVAVCLILAIAIYCYKQNLHSNAPDPYMGGTPETWPDPGVQMNHFVSEDDIYDERSGHQDKLLANDLIVPISPYRVITGYRRPNTTGESDHGYSTMTPHDDSEHLAFASMEPFMSRDASTVGDTTNSPAASLRASITETTTILPCGKNNVIAPVTVHRHMEAT